jgi:glycine hydroxymethyltransferase
MGVDEMRQIGRWIDEVVTAAGKGDEESITKIGAEVRSVTSAFPAPGITVA